MTDPNQTTPGTCPAEHGGRREDCAAYPACACDYQNVPPSGAGAASVQKTTSDVRSETDRRTILMLIEHCRDKDARIEELEEALRQLRRNIDDVVPRRD